MEEALKVYKLDLYNQGLAKVPAEILEFRNLQVIDCSKNKLTALSKYIGKLTNLTEINRSDNQLTTLPAEIGKLINIKLLNCFAELVIVGRNICK